MKNKILNVIKWSWLIIVLGVAGWYLFSNFSDLSIALSEMDLFRLILSFLLIVFGRTISAHLTFESLKLLSQPIHLKEAFSIATVTQLGKYLPGGIWHFAGKIGVYKARGMSVKESVKPVILETIWLFASALAVGSSAFLLSSSDLLCRFTAFLCLDFNKSWLILPLLFGWVMVIIIINHWFGGGHFNLLASLKTSVELMLMWLLFGISLWILFPKAFDMDYLLLTTTAFAVSWLAGYAAVFAPGGIGIREAVLALLLAGFFPTEVIAIHASIHRLLWVMAELILAATAVIFFGMPMGLKKEDTADGIREK